MSDKSDSAAEAVLAELGQVVRATRIAKHLTQAELSARSGLSRDTVSRLERGAPVDTSTLARLATALGCRIELRRIQWRAADIRRKYAHLHEDAE
jgi:transcriptional regulator with XRE-family HTH domain